METDLQREHVEPFAFEELAHRAHLPKSRQVESGQVRSGLPDPTIDRAGRLSQQQQQVAAAASSSGSEARGSSHRSTTHLGRQARRQSVPLDGGGAQVPRADERGRRRASKVGERALHAYVNR